MYYRIVLGRPWLTLLAIFFLISISGYYAQSVYLDASADSLVLENDESLRYHRSIQGRYESDDYLVITYTPEKDLFSASTLNDLDNMHNELLAIDAVSSVTSILNVPLINSPPIGFSDIQRETPTLRTPSTNIGMARTEFLSSPLYQNLLISPDGKTTALQINLNRDEVYTSLLKRRSELRELSLESSFTDQQQSELDNVSNKFRAHNISMQAQQQETIDAVRAIMSQHNSRAKLHFRWSTNDCC
jgi:Predicted exporters of the RND superfamily